MKIYFDSQDHYVREFDPVDLPNFCVWTGVNGAGKTRLMKAIESGHVKIDNVPKEDIQYYNYNDFLYKKGSGHNSQQIDQFRTAAWKVFIAPGQRNQNLRWSTILQQLYNQFFTSQIDGKSIDLIDKYLPNGISLWEAHADPDKIPDTLKDPLHQFVSNVKSRIFSNPQFKAQQHSAGIKKVIKKASRAPHNISEEQFAQHFVPAHSSNDYLASSLGVVFSRYKVAQFNWVHNYVENSAGSVNVPRLYAQYELEHEKPWEIFNQILRSINRYSHDQSVFNFQLTHPGEERLKIQHSQDYYFEPTLIDQNDGVERNFDHLSSGEKVLLALALSVYEEQDDFVFPSVLLLDEIDASLHPSMILALTKTLQSIFSERGTKVIMATHSPSTIALAPQGSVCVVNKGPVKDKLKLMENKDALEILTEGYATVEDGISLFDNLLEAKSNILTEGHNVQILEHALALYSIEGVNIVAILKEETGKNSMAQYYRLFQKIGPGYPLLFVWDVDAEKNKDIRNFEESENLYKYILPKNTANALAKDGIENVFPESIFGDEYVVKVQKHGKPVERYFDGSKKKEFANHVVESGTKQDFELFLGLVEKVQSITASD